MKWQWIRIGTALILFALALLFPIDSAGPSVVPFLFVYLLAGADVLLRAIRNIGRGQVFDENFLMAIASIGAFLIGEHPEGVAIMLFYQVGEAVQGLAVARSRRDIARLMDLRPDTAMLLDGETYRTVDPAAVDPGAVILVKPGERVPLDGTVLDGSSSLDVSALTGEPAPRPVSNGDLVLSGSVNLEGPLQLRVETAYGESTVSRILALVEEASHKKARAERFISRFARYYTPAVVIGAALLAVLPPLLLPGATWSQWIYRALIFLVVSCPCALVISVPLSFFGGIGGASRRGILVKGSDAIEALAKVETVVFDKTGTLTQGAFRVLEIRPASRTAAEVLEAAAHGELYSNHPTARAIKEAYGQAPDAGRITAMSERPGKGIEVQLDGRPLLAGNRTLLEEAGISVREEGLAATWVHVAWGGELAGSIALGDEYKPESRRAIEDLKNAGVEQLVLLTGDSEAAARRAGDDLGIPQVYGGLLPGGKIEHLERALREASPRRTVAFVGDGINDAPVLARADVGIAMGGLGSDAAIEAADVVLMNDDPAKVAEALKLARKTLGIARENIALALGVKGLVLLLGAFGFASMWSAVFADVGVTLLAVGNALRALRR